jgi:hypothetical protein
VTSKADQRRFDALHRIGCVACRKDGRYSQIQVHHLVDKGTRKLSGGNQASLPLCPWHHVGQPADDCSVNYMYTVYGPSLRLHKKEFNHTYGSQRQLLEEVNLIIDSLVKA